MWGGHWRGSTIREKEIIQNIRLNEEEFSLFGYNQESQQKLDLFVLEKIMI